jgi:hypothetical protein
MKPKSKSITARRTKQPIMQSIETLINDGLRRPFSNPIPVQDELMRRFGPKHPVPVTKQTRGN